MQPAGGVGGTTTGADCLTVTVCPATVMAPTLSEPPFSAACTSTVPGPVREAAPTPVSHDAPPETVQEHSLAVDTTMFVDVAAADISTDVGVTAKAHAKACWVIRTATSLIRMSAWRVDADGFGVDLN